MKLAIVADLEILKIGGQNAKTTILDSEREKNANFLLYVEKPIWA